MAALLQHRGGGDRLAGLVGEEDEVADENALLKGQLASGRGSGGTVMAGGGGG